jgi:hypothetical protein
MRAHPVQCVPLWPDGLMAAAAWKDYCNLIEGLRGRPERRQWRGLGCSSPPFEVKITAHYGASEYSQSRNFLSFSSGADIVSAAWQLAWRVVQCCTWHT